MVVTWTPLAVNSLNDIYRFYLPQTGRNKALQIVEEIRNETRYLLIFPELGAIEQSDSLPDNYRYIIKNCCKIYYTVHSDHINIALVWDTRRNPEHLREYIKDNNPK